MKFSIFNLQFSIPGGVTRGGGHHGRGPVLVSRRKGHGAAERQDPKGGQSLFEVVVAIAISALIIVTIVSLVTNSLRNADFAKNNALATSYASQATEWIRTQRDTDINTFMTNVSVVAPAPTTYCFVNLDWSLQNTCGYTDFLSGTIFIRQGEFSVTTAPGGQTVVEADVTVFWTDAQGTHQVVNSTDFTDWRQR